MLCSCTKKSKNITESEEFIFIGHPRTNVQINQSMLPSVEKIDYSRFSMTLLGGDLTQNSTSYKALSYLDSILDLQSPNTLFALGNHDYPNPLLDIFTGRDAYYAYFRNGITYLVLKTEEPCPGNTSNGAVSNICNDQLNLIQEVSDTISQSNHLIIIHHRILWMMHKNLDSLRTLVGGSTSNMTETNFYTAIYPLLLNIESKGIDVVCVAGAGTNINVEYMTNDSIQFIATGMKPDQPDSTNYVIIFQHDIKRQKLDWEFYSLNEL